MKPYPEHPEPKFPRFFREGKKEGHLKGKYFVLDCNRTAHFFDDRKTARDFFRLELKRKQIHKEN